MAGFSGRARSSCRGCYLTTWKRVNLGSSAVEYVRDCLAKGHTLSKYLLQRDDLVKGIVFACVPSSISDQTAENFRDGPLLPEPSADKHIYQQAEAGHSITMVPVPNTDDILADLIKAFLQRTNDGICVFEEAMARPSDPCMAASRTEWLEYDDEVYYFLLSNSTSVEKILEGIRQAATTYPALIGVMATIPDMKEVKFALRRKRITDEGLSQLANRTEKIIIGAYDGEGYLIWEGREGG